MEADEKDKQLYIHAYVMGLVKKCMVLLFCIMIYIYTANASSAATSADSLRIWAVPLGATSGWTLLSTKCETDRIRDYVVNILGVWGAKMPHILLGCKWRPKAEGKREWILDSKGNFNPKIHIYFPWDVGGGGGKAHVAPWLPDI